MANYHLIEHERQEREYRWEHPEMFVGRGRSEPIEIGDVYDDGGKLVTIIGKTCRFWVEWTLDDGRSVPSCVISAMRLVARTVPVGNLVGLFANERPFAGSTPARSSEG